MKILFVCTANISRSFLAEKLMQHQIEQRRIDGVEVKSAGVYATPGGPPDPVMLEYLAQNDVPVTGHASRRIQRKDVDWADYILVMEAAHAREIVRMWPESEQKVDLLGRFISMDGSADDVIDPFGRSSYHYRLAQSQIVMGINSFLEMHV
jgi:protein-tyrosine phosphatase